MRDRLSAFVLSAVFTGLPLVADSASSACVAPADSKSSVTGEFAPLGLAVGTFSKTVLPGDDFFTYVNEGWIASTPIPEGHWDYGQTTVLIDQVARQIRQLLEETSRERAPRGSVEQQVGDAYSSFLDVANIEHDGLSAVRADVARILRARSRDAIARWMAHPTSSSLVAINVYPAERHWRVHLDQQNLTQPMLGLPNPDDYSRGDAAAAAMRESYHDFVAEMLTAVGVADANARAQRLLALETGIAANFWPFEKLRDRKANYHPMTVHELEAYAPGFPWKAFLRARGVGGITDLVLGTDTAVQRQAQLFAQTSIEDWQTYLVFHWLQNQADLLPDAIQRASWGFYGAKLSNAKERPPREELATQLVSNALSQPVGKLYVQRFVSEETRSAAQEMISYLAKAFAARLDDAKWMDEATRSAAKAKLARFQFKVAYPKIWRDFSGIRIERADAMGNLQRLRQADWEYQRRRLDPSTRDEPWHQTPQTVDASYSVLMNAIELPGAFLQPPYFDAHADPAVNFGAIGAIVGHEMGHAFDDQGIIYDADGVLRNWWTETSLAEFHRRASRLIAQYEAFAPYPDVHVDGQRTLGENIADLSGLLLAHHAYQLYLADYPCESRESRDGLTGEQRFFAAWAQAWRYRAPESAVRHVIRWSFHSPTPYRVNGVVRNLDAWYEAFGVRPGSKLYLPPEQRVRIW